MEFFFAIVKAGHSALSLITAFTITSFLSFGEFKIASRFEPLPETKTATLNTIALFQIYKFT